MEYHSSHSMIKRFAKKYFGSQNTFYFLEYSTFKQVSTDMWISYKIFWIIVYIYISVHTFNIYNENVRTIQLTGTNIISISTNIIFKSNKMKYITCIRCRIILATCAHFSAPRKANETDLWVWHKIHFIPIFSNKLDWTTFLSLM